MRPLQSFSAVFTLCLNHNVHRHWFAGAVISKLEKILHHCEDGATKKTTDSCEMKETVTDPECETNDPDSWEWLIHLPMLE